MDEKLQKTLEEKLKIMENDIFNEIDQISDENIKKAQKQLLDTKTTEYLEKLDELQDKLKKCAERMKIDKERGNTAGEAEEHSRYSYLVELINELKENRIKELENMFSSNSKKSGETLEDLDKKITHLEQKAKEVAQRMRADKEFGNYAGEAQAHAEFNEIIQQINDLKNKKVAIIDNKINELEDEATKVAQVMKADRQYGNYAGEAQAHSNYSKLIVEINELKKMRQSIINPVKMKNNTAEYAKKEEIKRENKKDKNEDEYKDDTKKDVNIDDIKKLSEETNINTKIVFSASRDKDLPFVINAFKNEELDNSMFNEELGDKYFFLRTPRKNNSARYIGEYYNEIMMENAMRYGLSPKMQKKSDPMMLYYYSQTNEKEAENMARRIRKGKGLEAYSDIISYDMTLFKKLGFFEKRVLRKIVKNAVRDGLQVKNYENTFSLWDKIVNKVKSLRSKKKTPKFEEIKTENKNKKSARVDFFESLDQRDTVSKNFNKKETVAFVKHNENKADKYKDEDENVI